MDHFYYESETEFEKIHYCLKQRKCPHCNIIGTLILHGYLRGYAPGHYAKFCNRGHRVFCSNRGKKKGCGRTFSIIRAMFMKGFTFCTKLISDFLKDMLSVSAVSSTPDTMSVSTAYRIRNLFKTNQSFIREKLLKKEKPPFCLASDPVHKSVRHLLRSFPFHEDPVQAFQLHFQLPFFTKPLPQYGLLRQV